MDFIIMDCALLTRMSGLPPAYNLRDLRDRISVAHEDVLYHHFCETPLRATFDDPEYRNDLAVWAKEHLGDRILAERLGILDPYEIISIETLRRVVIDIIDDRLSELSPWVPTARPGHEFFFMESVNVLFETNDRVVRPSELSREIRSMSNGSLYFHFLEARRRPPLHLDDFTAWLVEQGDVGQPYIKAIEAIDIYFKPLSTIREELVATLDHNQLEIS